MSRSEPFRAASSSAELTASNRSKSRLSRKGNADLRRAERLLKLDPALSKLAEHVDGGVDAAWIVVHVRGHQLLQDEGVQTHQVLGYVLSPLHVQGGHELH